MDFDFQLFRSLYGLTGQEKILDWLFIFFAKFMPYILLLSFIIMIWRMSGDWRRRIYYGGYTAITLVIAWSITLGLRTFIPRNRPFIDMNIEPLINASGVQSLPSIHAMLFFSLAFVLFFAFAKRKAAWLYQGPSDALKQNNAKGMRSAAWFGFVVLLMATSRIIVGIHWPLDIIAGILVALLSVIVSHRLLSLSQ